MGWFALLGGCGLVGDLPRRRRRMLFAAWVVLMVFVGIPVLVNGLALLLASFRGW